MSFRNEDDSVQASFCSLSASEEKCPLLPTAAIKNAFRREFFNSLSRGKAYWTVGGFIGAGAFFGSDKSNVFGVNFRYYFTYLLAEGIPSLFNPATGEVSSTKSSFGGFFITLNIGMGS